MSDFKAKMHQIRLAHVWPTSGQTWTFGPRRILFILYRKLCHSTQFICRDRRPVRQNDIETARFCIVVDVFLRRACSLWDMLFTPYQQTTEIGRLAQHILWCFRSERPVFI